MKVFRLRDLILKSSQNIYNNLAKVENIKGRLTIELEITPNPLISWEFECLDKAELNDIEEDELNEILFKKPLNSIIANKIEIIDPYCRNVSQRLDGENEKRCCEVNASGYSKELCIGDMNKEINALNFYIPNFRIHAICKEHNLSNDDSRWKYGNKGSFIVEEPLLNNWMISFETHHSSFKWLDPIKANTGILLTSIGSLYQNEKEEQKNISFWDIIKKIEQLFLLLSFANGGYTYPILYEGYRFPPEDRYSASVFKYFNSKNRITPLEQLSNTWFIRESDLSKLIQCYEKFTSVFDSKYWHDSFLFILANYILATSTHSWQIAASAIGAVIERLAFLILIEDEADAEIKEKNKSLFNKKKPRSIKRIERTLKKIGLTKERYIDDVDYIGKFVGVRNDAVHPINNAMTEKERWRYIRYGIQWAEEIILWKLEYSGWYRDRISSSKEENKQYQASPGIFVPRYFIESKKTKIST